MTNKETVLLDEASKANAEALRIAHEDKTMRSQMPDILAKTAQNFILMDMAYTLKELLNAVNRVGYR